MSINCNWKAVLDNFSELYHVHYLHPQHRRFVDCTESLSECYEGGHTRVWVPGAKTDSLFSTPDKPTDLLTMQLEALASTRHQYEGKVDEIQAAVRVAKTGWKKSEPYYGNFYGRRTHRCDSNQRVPQCHPHLSARDAVADATPPPRHRPQPVLPRQAVF